MYSKYNDYLNELQKKIPYHFINLINNTDITIIKKNKIIIIFDYDNEFIEKINNLNIIIFFYKNNFSDKKKFSNIYDNNILFDDLEYLKNCLEIYFREKNKTFTILITTFNSSKYLPNCLKSIYKQTYNNFKIFICDDFSSENEYKTILKYKKLPNIFIFRNERNIGKFMTINNILDKIDTDYFTIVDCDDIIKKNRLLLDIIYFKLTKEKIVAVQSKYYRKNLNGEHIVKSQFGHTSITFKTKIIKKIGYFCPNRFGGDTEYILRIKKFLGDKSIHQYDIITYEAYLRNDNTNLIKIYNSDVRKIFLNKITNILNKSDNIQHFQNKNLDYFVDLNKLNNILNLTLDCDMYKKFYKDLNNFNNDELINHWKSIGILEGRLCNMYYFDKYFPNFDYKLYLKNNNLEILLNNNFEVFGWVYLKNKLIYKKWLLNNGFINKNYLNKNLNSSSNNITTDLFQYIKTNNIKYICISKSLKHFEKRIINKFKLLEYNNLSDKFENTLFFGLYDKYDYYKIFNHLGNIHLMWGGTDTNINYKIRFKVLYKISEYLNIKHVVISEYIANSLDKFNIKYTMIYLNIVDTNIFKPLEQLGKNIYIYNGFTKGNEEIYNKSLYEQIMQKIPEFNYILSNNLSVDYEQMPNIYSKCFIGLRLTNYDGNANTVQEFNAMNIPIIFNGIGGIKWSNIDDIIDTIKKYNISTKFLKINNESTDINFNDILHNKNKLVHIMKNYDEVVKINFYDDSPNYNLELIYKNIDNFYNLFKSYNKILFICGDYPGYGGAATNCDKLQDFFISKGNITYAIYFNYIGEENVKYAENNKFKIVDQKNLSNELKKINIKPDLIILKSNISINLKEFFDCPIIFLIPGIFTDKLNKYYTKLNKDEYDKYINKNIITQINNSDISFSNSLNTQKILYENYKIITYLFYSSFVSFYKKKINFDNNFNTRKYDFGIIISNFNRNIKNIEKSIKFLKDKKNVILIGKNSNKYIEYGFDCFDLLDNVEINEQYKNIKYIIQNSFYESCSNVKIEAIMNGCEIINEIIIPLNYKDINYSIQIEKNNNYIIGNFSNFYNGINYKSLFVKNSFEAYIINQEQTKELIFFINTDYDISINLNDLFKNVVLNNKKIGCNKNLFSDIELINLYYMYGFNLIEKKIIGINLFYENYIDNNRKFYNKKLYLLIYSYYYGEKKNVYNLDEITRKINTTLYYKDDVLVISKLILGYGGVQKTSYQIIQTIDSKYNVLILSNNIIDFKYDDLNDDIPNILIVKLNNKNDIQNYIIKNNFAFIINNKLEKILEFDFDNKKINYICHNSMDPFNNLLLKNKNKIDKLFTINNFHRNLMINNGFGKNIFLYNNYILDKLNTKSIIRKKFTFCIGFIGRISKEKNIQLLIDGLNNFNDTNKIKIKLFIIGDGKEKLINLSDNIILTGRLDYEQIIEYYNKFDYIISASLTEGKPFSIIEAISYGIPCIHSNINGIDEIIIDNVNGFLFNFQNYDLIKFEQNFDCLEKINQINNIENISNILKKAYNIDINIWNEMSKNCISLCDKKYLKEYCFEKNLNLMELDYTKKYLYKYKIFVNFKPDENKAYGGGNISVYYIVRYLSDKYSDFEITYELCENIDIYFIIDPFKDNKFKKYDIDDIILHKKNNNSKGKIIIRINDCDITRTIINKNLSREYKIISNYKNIDYMIFNSNFIKSYYLEKINNQYTISNNYSVIINGCDENIFKNENKKLNKDKKIKIVTHHWSNNINKGYETYYKLWKYSQTNKNIEFVFIGKNVPEMFKEVPIIGPYVGKEISNELNKCNIYITDSKYDSCPNHILEALSCGLPILYSNCEGGARELCMMSKYEIGEIYNNFDELLLKIKKINENYNYYIDNIVKSKYLYDIHFCVSKYYNIFIKNISSNFNDDFNDLKLQYENNIININCVNSESYITLDESIFKLVRGNNIFAINKSSYNKIQIIDFTKDITISNEEFTANTKKLNNDKINILLCSDSNYLVGLFAVLNSVIINTDYLNYVHFNFIIPIEKKNIFSKMLIEFELKLNQELDKSIIYLDSNIIDKSFFESKCYNSGGHLLNLGNLSRLLIGEFMEYNKLIYLDSDSIVQTDIIKKLLNFNFTSDLYSACANLENTNNKKRIIIKMDAIINCEYDWINIIGHKIDKEEYVYMGAPFITNVSKWINVYKNMINIIKIHNNTEGGIYKLFTMSIQNILFYKNISNINCVLNVLQDLGSSRKDWDIQDLISKDILDWSGIYKPWFTNGLYKHLWIHHDIMNLSENYGIIESNKNTIEKFIKTNEIKLSVNNEYLKINLEIFTQFEKYINNMIYSIKTNVKYYILYVCDANYLLNKMSRVRFWAIEELSKNQNVKLYILGPGFTNFYQTKSLQQNIIDLNVKFDIVIWYKPLDKNYNFDTNIKLPFKTCLRYNEMWDEKWTINEINESKTDIIICHHYNDYLRYKNDIYKDNLNKQFFYIPHHANPNIFKSIDLEKNIDIMMSGVAKQNHYPLKYRLFNLIKSHKNTILKKYNIYEHNHPGYKNDSSFLNINQINYNEIINKSKLCIACTSKYKYRLGKYVEIPMAESVIVGDLPYEDSSFKDFVVEVTMEMSDNEILTKIIDTLENQDLINQMTKIGNEWSKNYTTKIYTNNLLKIIKNDYKIYIISDEIKDNHPEFKNQKWICDVLKQEFINTFPLDTTNNAKEANIIWYLAPWNHRYIPNGFKMDEWLEFLKIKKVIFTQHHIDEDKLNLEVYEPNNNVCLTNNFIKGQLNKQFEFMKKYGQKFHTICNITKNEMNKYFDKSLISTKRLWINNKIFYYIENKLELRKKYNFSKETFLIGSFQKDTEGNSNLPKLSKGPDIFINIIKDMYLTNPNIEIILCGLRREYIIMELEKVGIKYYYFNMMTLEEINELYNCLNLYIISSRCEGGPRAVFEAGLTKTPIISTRVGIAPELMAKSSLFDSNKWITYKNAKPNIKLLYDNVFKLSTKEYIDEFKNYLIDI